MRRRALGLAASITDGDRQEEYACQADCVEDLCHAFPSASRLKRLAFSKTRLRRLATTVNRPRSKCISRLPPASKRRPPTCASPCAGSCGVDLSLSVYDGTVSAFIPQCCSHGRTWATAPISGFGIQGSEFGVKHVYRQPFSLLGPETIAPRAIEDIKLKRQFLWGWLPATIIQWCSGHYRRGKMPLPQRNVVS